MSEKIIGLAFRGNCNENFNEISFDSEKSYYRSNNEGNFLGLVKLLAAENSDLTEHIRKCKESRKTSERQPTYLSHNFVNKALLIIRKNLVSIIVEEIKRNGGSFGLLMDASQDITCKEQFSVVARYVNDDDEIVERTISFFETADTSGEALYNTLQAKLSEIGLFVSNIIGC